MKKIKIAQFGLGSIGVETLKLAATKSWAEVVAGFDVDPAKIGRPLKEITDDPALRGARVYRALEELPENLRPDIVFHTTVSDLALAAAQIEPLLRAGINVVSSCEEMVFPQLKNPELAVRLDKACKDGSARLVGTGVNPGFVMDVLPLCLSGVCRQVRAVHVQRVVNASTRRASLQKKIGCGLPPSEFERKFQEGRAGHAGLKESLALLAHGLSWKIKDITETCKAVVAHHEMRTHHVEVRSGQTCGLHQRAEAAVNGTVCLTLDLKMYLDAPNPHDACQIDGDPPLNCVLNGGVPGDIATVASLVNAAPRVLREPPGLLLLTDLGIAPFA